MNDFENNKHIPQLQSQIPKQLSNKIFRFIKIKKHNKIPVEEGWQKTHNYHFDDPQLLDWIKRGNNVGVLCGSGKLVVVDCDEKNLADTVRIALRKTFTVQTGSGGYHFYFIVPDFDKKIVLKDASGNHCGEVQFAGSQVVCPPSIHPNGTAYKIADDVEISAIAAEQLRFALQDYIKDTITVSCEDNTIDVDISNVVDLSTLKQRNGKPSEYQGAHPLHGSKNESNFTVDTSKGIWYCFRHGTGGDALSLIAVLEGVLQCEDAVPGALTKTRFKKVLKIAEDKYGLKTHNDTPNTSVEYKNPPKSLEEVYTRVQKWLYLPDTDRLDLILGVALSTSQLGMPLWVFFVGGSGDGKSELIRALEKLPYARKIDQLTANTFASGKKNVKDLGSELQGKHTLLLFTDLACLTSLNKDEKKKIWSQFRTLFDGEIYKDTGSGVKKAYDNCNVTILAASTNAIKEEYHIHQQLGTRELLYDTDADPSDNKTKMKKALKHQHQKKQMKQEIQEAVSGFLIDKKFNNTIEIPDEIIDFLFGSCEKLRILRATGKTDWKTGEVDIDIEAEVTTRLIQQFCLLYQALKSLDHDYPDSKFKCIVEKFVKSSSHPVRFKLYKYFKKNDDWITIYNLHKLLKNSRIMISSQCESLWNLGVLEKEFREEQVGYENSNRWKQVAYYRPVPSNKEAS